MGLVSFGYAMLLQDMHYRVDRISAWAYQGIVVLFLFFFSFFREREQYVSSEIKSRF